MADIGIRGYGPTLAEAFAQAAMAMTAVVTDPQAVQAEREILIQCEGDDEEFLFYDWINALVYEMSTRHMLFSQFQVRIQDHRLEARVRGESTDVERHQPAVEIKGATLTELKARPTDDGGWLVQCVVDV
jgi:tRNA nucleotidyltransferase (CCA-adding enzyme)